MRVWVEVIRVVVGRSGDEEEDNDVDEDGNGEVEDEGGVEIGW